jgi:glycosyltransferase involved in cell wall biosynthesis
MRILYVVQRYGEEVAGGAELACRLFATKLAGRGHEVHVVTSRARSYLDWADAYPSGTTVVDGVTVHRLGVRGPRPERFARVHTRALWSHKLTSPPLQEAFMKLQGPDLRDLVPWLEAEAPGFDVVVFVTYLYWPTWRGLPAVTPLAATVLHPAAHDEPTLWMATFDRVLSLPTRLALFTPEEQDLVARRTRNASDSEVIGIGIDVDVLGDPARFRTAFDLGNRPYLLYVGRVDTAKGAPELLDQFVAYKDRHPRSDLALVVVGEPASPLEPRDDLVLTGFVDEQTKTDALAGCLALAQPSYFESFSLALAEAWVQRRPGLVQGHCAVLAGQVARSGGGVAAHDFAEWEAAVEILESGDVADELGRRGRRYVEAMYQWDVVLDRYEALLADAASSFRRGRSPAPL